MRRTDRPVANRRPGRSDRRRTARSRIEKSVGRLTPRRLAQLARKLDSCYRIRNPHGSRHHGTGSQTDQGQRAGALPRQDDRPYDQRKRPSLRHHLRLDPPLQVTPGTQRRYRRSADADPARSAGSLQRPHRGEHRSGVRILRPRAGRHRGAGRHGSGAHQGQASGGGRGGEVRRLSAQHDVHAGHRHPQTAGTRTLRGVPEIGKAAAGLRSLLGRIYARGGSLHETHRGRRFETLGELALAVALRRAERRPRFPGRDGGGLRPVARHGGDHHPDRPSRTADPLSRIERTPRVTIRS